MKNKLTVLVCVAAISLAGCGRALASADSTPVEPEKIVVDAVLVRPLCLAATVIGSVFFVISLPFALTSKSVHRAATALVVWPAQATFTRPLGDLDELTDY